MKVNLLDKSIFNEMNIRRDFDIFVFKRKDNYSKNIPFDKLMKLKGCAISNQYYNLHLISKKGTITTKVLEDLKIEGFEVSEIDILQISNASLFNLFFNIYGSQNFICENDTSSVYGEFFYPLSAAKKNNLFRSAINIRYYGDQGLAMDIKTFKRVSSNSKKPKYQWKETSLVPSRVGYNHYEKYCWIQKARKERKSNINFFDNNNLKALNNSKAGILYKFIREFNDQFKEYINISLKEINDIKKYDITSDRETFLKTIRANDSFISINIVDLVKSEETKENITKLKSILNSEGIRTSESDITIPGFNIAVIKNAEYFENHPEEKDHHQKSYGEIIVQNITDDNFEVESQSNTEGEIDLFNNNPMEFEWKDNNLLFKVLQELLSKKSVLNGEISKGLLKNINISNNIYCLTFHKDKNDKRYILKSCLNESRRITFELIREDIFESNNLELKRVADFLNDFQIMSVRNLWKVECVFFESIDDLNLILRTKLYAYPDVNNIANILSLSKQDKSVRILKIKKDNEDFISKLRLEKNLAGVKLFEEINVKLSEIVEPTIRLNDYRSILKEYSELENGRKKLAKELFDHLYGRYKNNIVQGYLPFSNHKQGKFKESYASLTGINFCEKIPGIKSNSNKIYYWIGSKNKSIKPSYKKGNPIRILGMKKVDGKFSDKNILKAFFDVDFIRVNEATVRPFMFKFNNTYWELIKDDL